MLLLHTSAAIHAAPPAPPLNLIAKDFPNDTGKAIELHWQLSPDDSAKFDPRRVTQYEVRRAAADSPDELEPLEGVAAGVTQYVDQHARPGVSYLYEVVAVGPQGEVSEPVRLTAPVAGEVNWFDRRRLWFGFILLAICGVVLVFTELARAGRATYIRRIAGLDAVEEAVGRATEMGRMSLFIPGIQDMNDIQTVAGLTILSHVAQTVAEYNSTLEIPNARSLVMAAARESVQAAYLAAGRPDAYNADRIYYVTDDQFGFVGYVSGLMMRERPAACFYLGTFYAESLVFGETGNRIGAIQIAGTAETSQLPFFVAACDYTLIGEELFAASAYLSREPHQLGSLKGQDAGKVIAASLLLAGCLLATVTVLVPEWRAAQAALEFLRDRLLGEGAA